MGLEWVVVVGLKWLVVMAFKWPAVVVGPIFFWKDPFWN